MSSETRFMTGQGTNHFTTKPCRHSPFIGKVCFRFDLDLFLGRRCHGRFLIQEAWSLAGSSYSSAEVVHGIHFVECCWWYIESVLSEELFLQKICLVTMGGCFTHIDLRDDDRSIMLKWCAKGRLIEA